MDICELLGRWRRVEKDGVSPDSLRADLLEFLRQLCLRSNESEGTLPLLPPASLGTAAGISPGADGENGVEILITPAEVKSETGAGGIPDDKELKRVTLKVLDNLLNGANLGEITKNTLSGRWSAAAFRRSVEKELGLAIPAPVPAVRAARRAPRAAPPAPCVARPTALACMRWRPPRVHRDRNLHRGAAASFASQRTALDASCESSSVPRAQRAEGPARLAASRTVPPGGAQGSGLSSCSVWRAQAHREPTGANAAPYPA